MAKTFEYKKIKPAKYDDNLNRIKESTSEKEALTGMVKGEKASDLEERFANALWAKGLEFDFQVTIPTAVSLPTESKTVDFIVMVGSMRYPIEIDGRIGHLTESQRAEDSVKELLLNEQFKKNGMNPLSRVRWYEIETKEEADYIVSKLLGV